MIKSSKIWKIESVGYELRNGATLEESYRYSPKIDTQFIYDTELDCLLDIVTEPENNGLKVYKHQIRVDERIENGSEKIYVPIRKKNLDAGCSYTHRIPILWEKNDFIDNKSNDYEISFDNSEFKDYMRVKYYWVEAFMQ